MNTPTFASEKSYFELIRFNIKHLSIDYDDMNQRTNFETTMLNAVDEENVSEIKATLMGFHKKFPNNAIVKELLESTSKASLKAIATDSSYDYSAIYGHVRSVYHNFEVNSSTNKKVIPLIKPLPYEVCKQIAIDTIEDYYKDYQKFIFPFIVSPNTIIKGRIIEETQGAKRQILVSNNKRLNRDNTPNFSIRFLGEQHPITSEVFDVPMYVYTMIASGVTESNYLTEYTLLSMTPLPHEEIQITGMEMHVRDKLKIGVSAQLDISTPTIFVLNHTKILDNINEDQFNDIIKDYKSHDSLYELYFSRLRQPTLFEILLLTLMFCRKGSQGYPLHFGMFGPASCGKSKILEAISGRFGEMRALESGTLKSLMPNFGGAKPDPGHFTKSRRFCTVDEFLDLVLKSSPGQHNPDIEGFNSLLMHASGVSGSGKHTDSLVVKPTAAMIFASNYKPGKIDNFVELCDKVNIPFLSRFMLYNYTEAHVDFIRHAEEELMSYISKKSYEEKKDISISDFVGDYDIKAIQISDYLKATMTLINQKEVYEIYNEVRNIVPDDDKIKELYNARSPKIIEAILDGVIKYHYITEGRTGEFICRPKDLELTKELWYMVVSSWTENHEQIPLRFRERTLTKDEMHVYNLIKKEPGITAEMLEQKTGKHPGTYLKELTKLELVTQQSMGQISTYYPYFYIDPDEFDIKPTPL